MQGSYCDTDLYPLPPTNVNKIDESFESLLRLINEETFNYKSSFSSFDWANSFGKQTHVEPKIDAPAETSKAFVDDLHSSFNFTNKAKVQYDTFPQKAVYNGQEHHQYHLSNSANKNLPLHENLDHSRSGTKPKQPCCQRKKCKCNKCDHNKTPEKKPDNELLNAIYESENTDNTKNNSQNCSIGNNIGSQTSHDSQKSVKRFLPDKPPIHQSEEVIIEEIDKIIDPKTNSVTTVTKMQHVQPTKKTENSAHAMRHSSIIIKSEQPIRKLPSIEEATNESKYEDELPIEEKQSHLEDSNIEQPTTRDAKVQTSIVSVVSNRKKSGVSVSLKESEGKIIPHKLTTSLPSQISEIEDIRKHFSSESKTYSKSQTSQVINSQMLIKDKEQSTATTNIEPNEIRKQNEKPADRKSVASLGCEGKL